MNNETRLKWFEVLNSRSINLLFLSVGIIGLNIPNSFKLILWGLGGMSVIFHIENDRVLYFGERDKLEDLKIKKGLLQDEYDKLKNGYFERKLFYKSLSPYYINMIIYAASFYHIANSIY